MTDDKKLVEDALIDPQRFGPIVSRYQGKLDQFLWRIGVADESDREDLLQEVFLKIYRYLNDYDASMTFSTWAYRIARNTTYDFFRKVQARGLKVDFDEESYDIFWDHLVDVNQDLSADFDRDDRALKLREILEKLPEKYREVLVLFYLEEKSYTEISDILEKSQNTIATWIARAKTSLKAEIEKYYNNNLIADL